MAVSLSPDVCYFDDSGLGVALIAAGVGRDTCFWLSRLCLDSMDLLVHLPVSFLPAVVGAPEDIDKVVQVRSTALAVNGGLPLARFPRAVRAPRRTRLSERDRVSLPNYGQSFEPGIESVIGIELMAAGRIDFTGERLAVVIESVFKEVSWIRALNNTKRDGELLWHTFSERCRASGMEALIPALPLDKDEDPSGCRAWSQGPRDRIRALATGATSAPPEGYPRSALRHPRLLMLEAGLRLQLQAITRSWRSVASGLRAWGAFCSAMFPQSPHFPICDESLMSYAVVFRNPGTFSQYLGHMTKGEDLLRLSSRTSQRLVSALRRSTRAFHTPSPMPRLRKPEVRALVHCAVGEGCPEEARIYVIAYDFLFRVANELLPIQLDGRYGVPDDCLDWHSTVDINPGVASVKLRSRKNAPHGAVVRRHCVCTDRRRLLCGTCALSAQVAASKASRRSPKERLFVTSPASALSNLKRRCSALALPVCGWHAFRRGGAEDRVASGEELGHVLHAGGWRSSSFLRYISKENLDTQLAFESVIGLSDEE